MVPCFQATVAPNYNPHDHSCPAPAAATAGNPYADFCDPPPAAADFSDPLYHAQPLVN
jgi:hypothetical protein